MKKARFYYCPICGNIVEKVHDSGNDIECCGRPMLELSAGITDGKTEWHVPFCEMKDGVLHVRVGEQEHPMTEEHHIEWVEIVTSMGVARKYFKPGCKPEACFLMHENEKLCAAYAYCNKHKLWKLNVK